MELKEAKALARSRMGDKRFAHTVNVKKAAVKLARRYGEDEQAAALAALLHDSAKEMPLAEMLELMRKYPDLSQNGEHRPTPVWHGICAAILARTEWGVTDEGILSAIACHTTGKPGMSRLDKIIFLADMICEERDFPGVERLRALAQQNLDAAVLAGLEQTIRFVQKGAKPLDPMSKAAYQSLKEAIEGPSA